MAKSGDFKINQKAIDQLEKDLTAKWGRVAVPTDGTEAAAIASVKQQLRAVGLTNVSDSVVRDKVRAARRA